MNQGLNQLAPESMIDRPGKLYFMHRDVALQWVIELSSCGSTCFQVGMLLRHWSVLAKKDVITALSKKFSDFGISKDQKRSALFKLEKHNSSRISDFVLREYLNAVDTLDSGCDTNACQNNQQDDNR